jgi:hypothetical protein
VAAAEQEVGPKKIGCLQLISSEAASDANAAAPVGGALVAALASGVDQQFFLGTDADGPDGIEDFYTAGLEEIDASASTAAAIAERRGTAHPTNLIGGSGLEP